MLADKDKVGVHFGMVTVPVGYFESQTYPCPASGCWFFMGYLSNGYGKIPIRRNCVQRDFMAHRISYELYKGPIPLGLNILHHCDVPCCVNPNHLYAGTQKENVHDMIRRGRAKNPKGPRTKKVFSGTYSWQL